MTQTIDIGRVNLEMIDDNEVRSCGECTACCTSHSVDEIGKGHGEPCKHLCGTGCGIYADRPQSCQLYNCWYRAGKVPMRPDRCGIVFDCGQTLIMGRKVYTMRAYEMWDGAAKTPENAETIRKLREQYGFVAVFSPTNQRMSNYLDERGSTPFLRAQARKKKRV